MNDSVMILLAILAVVTLLLIVFRGSLAGLFEKWNKRRTETREKSLPQRAVRQAHSPAHSTVAGKGKKKRK